MYKDFERRPLPWWADLEAYVVALVLAVLIFGGSRDAFASFPATATTSTVWNSGTCWSGFSAADANACTAGKTAHDPQTAGDQFAATNGWWRGDGPAAVGAGGASGGGQWYGCDSTGPFSTNCWATNNGKRVRDLWKNNSSCPSGFTYNSSSGSCTGTTYTCPSGATASGSGSSTTCTCNSGFVEQGGTCVAQSSICSGVNGQSVTMTYFAGYDTNGDGATDAPATYPGANSPVNYTAPNGCQARYQSTQTCYARPDAPTKIYCDATFSYNGQTGQTGDGAPAAPNDSNPCPSGQQFGTVNGVPTCVTPNTTPPPAPSKSNTNSNTVNNGDGTSTTTTTKCTSSGACTTTITTTNNTNNSVINSTSSTSVNQAGKAKGDSDQAEFCRDNPDSPMCKVSSFVGTCVSNTEPACDGDAVQCATAKATWEMKCALSATDARSELGEAIFAGTDATVLPKPGEPEVHDMSGAIDQSSFIGSSCPADVSVAVFGTSFLIKFSEACGALEMLGNLLVVCALIVAAFTVVL